MPPPGTHPYKLKAAPCDVSLPPIFPHKPRLPGSAEALRVIDGERHEGAIPRGLVAAAGRGVDDLRRRAGGRDGGLGHRPSARAAMQSSSHAQMRACVRACMRACVHASCARSRHQPRTVSPIVAMMEPLAWRPTSPVSRISCSCGVCACVCARVCVHRVVQAGGANRVSAAVLSPACILLHAPLCAPHTPPSCRRLHPSQSARSRLAWGWLPPPPLPALQQLLSMRCCCVSL